MVFTVWTSAGKTGEMNTWIDEDLRDCNQFSTNVTDCNTSRSADGLL